MNEAITLTPLQAKYLKRLVEQDDPVMDMDRYLRTRVTSKLQELINEFAIQVGKDVDNSLQNLKSS
jgi:hypothetical protein